MEQKSGEYRNDKVRVFVKRGEGCLVEFEVFPSKALIERGGDKIETLAFEEALALTKISPLKKNSPYVGKIKNLSSEEVHIEYAFESEPRVPLVDKTLLNLKLPKKKEIGQKEISEAIEKLTIAHADWEVVEDSSIQEGDFITIQINPLEKKGGRSVDAVRLEVKKGRMAQWMRDLTLGARTGDILEGRAFPSEGEKDFLSRAVRVKIKKVERKVLPKIDDAFAKKMGAENCEGIAPLVQSVLERQEEERIDEMAREQVNHFLTSRYEFDIPKSLLDEEIAFRKSKNDEKAREELSSELRLFYLSRQIIEQQKISISNEEVQGSPFLHEKNKGGAGNCRDTEAVRKVFLRKAQDYLLEKE